MPFMRRWVFTALGLSVPAALVFACGLDEGTVRGTAPENDAGGIPSDASYGVDDSSTGGDASIGGGDAGRTSDGGGGGSDSGSDAGTAPILVYANTSTDIWSYDVVNGVLTKLGAIGCSGNVADIAIDGAGQMFVNEANDAIYDIAPDTGVCSNRGVLDSLAGDHNKIAARAAGTPEIVAVDPQNASYIGIGAVAAASAHVTKIVDSEFPDSPQFDLVCNAAGSCWTALAHNNCSSGSGSACLYSFPADGSSAAISRGAIAIHPAGLAYANGSLWAFADDGRIYSINTSGTPTANEVTPKSFVNAAAEPASWSGAASSSNY